MLVLMQCPALAATSSLSIVRRIREGTKKTSAYRTSIKLWEASDGLGYAQCKDMSGNKLRFRSKLYNHSSDLTLKAAMVYYYATDVWGDEIYDGTYYYHTNRMNLGPGEKAYTDYIYLPQRDEIELLYVGIKQLAFTDGTIVEFDYDEIDWYSWIIGDRHY